MARHSAVTLLVLLGCLSGAAATDADACHENCATCTSGSYANYFSCTSCKDGYTLTADGWGATGQCAHTGCEWTDEDSEDWYKRIFVGSIVGAILGIVMIIKASLPLCCGVFKGAKCLKPMAGIAMAVGIFVCFIPMIAGKATTDSAIADHCDGCRCSEKDEQDAKDALGALGVFVAYTYGFGFVCVIVGVIAASLSCCICCPCCGPLKREKQEGAASPPVAAVVGQPAGQACS